ncbi:MAG: TPM domain-containing protein [Clostridia bacterium]|nr:TPM domain-containing protein [Clostridia bacterium]
MRNIRLIALLAALVLCLSLTAPAFAETKYPPRPQGTVADLAGVLGESVITDLETLSSRLSAVTGGKIYVLTRHFLGGVNASNYAKKVFDVWALGANDALVLMVIGEETSAMALGSEAGKALPNDTQISLLANHFRTPFLARQYDEAVSQLALNVSQSLAKAKGQTLDVTGLFGQAVIQSTPQPQKAEDWWYGMFARDDYDARENDDDRYWQDWRNEWNYEETRINWRSVIIWGLVIYFLFFRKKRRRRR